MQYVHFYLVHPATMKPIPSDQPQAQVWINPAAVARIYAKSETVTHIIYLDGEDYDLVVGDAPTIVQMLEDAPDPTVDALDRIDEGISRLQVAVEGIDCSG